MSTDKAESFIHFHEAELRGTNVVSDILGAVAELADHERGSGIQPAPAEDSQEDAGPDFEQRFAGNGGVQLHELLQL